MTPLEILATSIAYAIMSDDDAATEEKAKMLGILGKHVSNGDLSSETLKDISKAAFAYAQNENMAAFLETHGPTLTLGQKFCIMINLFDIVMADGSLKMGEAEVLATFRNGFDIQKSDMQAVQAVLKLKNDTAVFLDKDHTNNSPLFQFTLPTP